jgi:hypothetical protein
MRSHLSRRCLLELTRLSVTVAPVANDEHQDIREHSVDTPTSAIFGPRRQNRRMTALLDHAAA